MYTLSILKTKFETKTNTIIIKYSMTYICHLYNELDQTNKDNN